jgi:hypothetical protein
MVEEEKRKEGEEEQGEIKKSEPFPTSFKFNESRNPGSDDNPIVIQALCFPRSGFHSFVIVVHKQSKQVNL